MKCVSCGGVLEINSDLESARCKTCGLEYSSEALATLKEKNGISPESGSRVEKEDVVPTVESAISEQNNKAYETVRSDVNNQTIQNYSSTEKVIEEKSQTPALENWKTSIGFSVFGLFAATALNSLVSIDINWIFINIIYLISSLVYAGAFYPRFYGEKPPTTDNKTISFCNLFFGGYLFGAIWNHNLTKREKGISNIVFIVYDILIVVTTVAMILTTLTANPLEKITTGKLYDQDAMWSYSYNVDKFIAGFKEQLDTSARDEGTSALTEMGLSEDRATQIWFELVELQPNSIEESEEGVWFSKRIGVDNIVQRWTTVSKRKETQSLFFDFMQKRYWLCLITKSNDRFGDEGYSICIQQARKL